MQTSKREEIQKKIDAAAKKLEKYQNLLKQLNADLLAHEKDQLYQAATKSGLTIEDALALLAEMTAGAPDQSADKTPVKPPETPKPQTTREGINEKTV